MVLYDRPGTGRSGPLHGSVVTAQQAAELLAELLRRAGIRPPYLLVGQSLGGLYVQAFARMWPRRVAAIVLVGAASPLEPPDTFVSTVRPRPGTATAAEDAGVAASMRALRTGPPLPLLVAADHHDTLQREALWRNVQARTAALSPRGQVRLIAGAGNFIQLDKPDAVITAIQDAAVAARLDMGGCHAATSLP